MRPAIGVNSVRATLEKSLLRAQRRFNLSNPSSEAKEARLQAKREERKLKKKLQYIARENRLLLGSSGTGDEFNTVDWRDLLVNPVQLEFVPAKESYEDFISEFRAQYTQLTSKKTAVATSTSSSLPARTETDSSDLKTQKKKIKGESKKLRRLRKILKKVRLAVKSKENEDEESLIPSSSKSKLELLREKRLKIRKIKKAIKKEAQRLRDEVKQGLVTAAKLLEKKVNKNRMKDMTVCENSEVDMVSSQGSGSTVLDSAKSSVSTKATLNGIVKKLIVEPQLPKPKFTLFSRDKIQLGWTQKYPAGCGFINVGNTCYMNSTLQAVFHIPSFVNWLLSDTTHRRQCESAQRYHQCMVCAMRNTLEESLSNRQSTMRPAQIHSKLRMISQNFVYGRQEDAHEFLRHLLESMETSYLRACGGTTLDTRSKETTPLGQIFGGYLRTEVTCLKCHHVSTTFQPLAELQLDIRHATSVAEAVGYHFRKEKVDNNDYKCEGCRSIAPVIKQFSLELPPFVLCLQLKRFTLFGGKLGKAIQCNRELDLTRFLHSSVSGQYPKNLKYRMVSLITHIGSSPNGGHYTAIAETSSGGLYHFDDSYVRNTPVQNTDSVSSDAYVIIYEMVDSSKEKPKVGFPSTSPAAQMRSGPVAVNGYSTQRFPHKSSTITSASPMTSNSDNPKPPIKFTFNQNAPRTSNPFKFNKPNSEKTPIVTSNSPIKTTSITMPKVVAVIGSNSAATNGDKAHHPGEIKGKNERTPITFSLKSPALDSNGGPSRNFGVRQSPSPAKPPFIGQSERRKSVSPKRVNGNTVSSVQSLSSNPKSSLVPYDDDSPEETPERNSRERSATPKNTNNSEAVKKKFDPAMASASTQIKSWADTGSLLTKATEVNRKRDLESSRADSYNEELDAGRTKKQKLDQSSQSTRIDIGVNKFQNYEDQKRLVNERTKSLMGPLKPSSTSTTGFMKDPHRSHHQGISSSSSTNNAGSSSENSTRPSSQYNNSQNQKFNQGRPDSRPPNSFYNNRGTSYPGGGNGYQGHHGGFRRFTPGQGPNSRFNDYRSHHRGGGGGGRGQPFRHNDNNKWNRHKSRNSYNNNNYYR